MKNLKTIHEFQNPEQFKSDDQLIVELSDSGLSLMRCNSGNKSIVGLFVYEFLLVPDANFNECINHLIGGMPCRQVRFFINYAQSLLVPALLHQARLNQNMLTLAYGDQSCMDIHYDDIPALQMVHVFSVPTAIAKWVQNDVVDASTFMHTSSALIMNKVNIDGLHVNFFYNSVKVIVCAEKKILINTSFVNHGGEDCLFQLLNICKQLALDPMTMPMYISGLLSETDPLFNHLNDYFGKLRFAIVHGWELLSNNTDTLPLHSFTHLIALATCE